MAFNFSRVKITRLKLNPANSPVDSQSLVRFIFPNDLTWQSSTQLRRITLIGKMKVLFTLLVVIVFSAVSGCREEPLAPKIRQDLLTSLSVGDSRSKIESVLKARGYSILYDKDLKRYESGVPMKSAERNEHGVSIEIYVDTSEHLSRIEVHDWYTGL